MLIFSQLWSFGSVDSTMEVARVLASRIKVNEVGLVMARYQSLGRGRLGRSWLSTSGAFLGTYLIRLNCTSLELSGFSLVVGLAIYRVLRKTGLNLYLKWPNDLISPDREKIGGILIEVIHQDKDILVLVGIGCNLAQSPPEIPSSTDLKSLGGQEITPIEFASALTPIFLEITDTFLNRGFKPFKSEWMEASYVPYEAIKIAQGVDVLTGSWGGVNDRGELVLLNQSQEEITISSGEVVF